MENENKGSSVQIETKMKKWNEQAREGDVDNFLSALHSLILSRP